MNFEQPVTFALLGLSMASAFGQVGEGNRSTPLPPPSLPAQRTAANAPKTSPLPAGPAAELLSRGKELFAQMCSACHGPEGEGIPLVAPPLARSEWVNGSEERLVRIILNGLEGAIRVNGVKYEPPMVLPEMPTMEVLSNDQIAALSSYVRRDWGNRAKRIWPAAIAKIRQATAQRQAPWTEKELLEIKPADPPRPD